MKYGEREHTGLVVIDVDGVIYRDIFLKKIVQSKGILDYVRIVILGIDYYLHRIPLSTLLEHGYKLADAFDLQKAREIARDMKKVAGIRHTVELLHSNGYYVALISAGIPDPILEDLSEEIGADHSRGMSIDIKDGNFTPGTVQVTPKTEIVEQLLEKLGLSWNDVVSVGDDPNNIELLKKSRLGIGFNPTRSVRANSDVVIEGHDLSEILPYIVPPERLPKKFRKERYNWKRELFRKGVHLLGCAVPYLARTDKIFTVSLLGGMILLYLFSEVLRWRGVPYPAVSHITRMAQRHTERKGIITGPLLLGGGILVTILLFDFPVYLPAILIVSVSDALSALVGQRFGRTRICGMQNRTLEGSAAFLISSLAILLFTCPPPVAAAATALATLLELVPVYNLDNFLIPVGTALLLRFVFGM